MQSCSVQLLFLGRFSYEIPIQMGGVIVSLLILSCFVVGCNSGDDGESGNYIGTKAPSDAKAVGDIVFSDGSATPCTAELALSDAYKSKAVAVIFYAGASTDALGEKTLGVGIHNTRGETYQWASVGTTGYTTNFTDIQCTPSASGSGAAETATFTGDLDGSDNWSKICATDTTAAANAATNYPAFNWANNYAATYSLAGDYASGWYLPTVAELSMMYRAKASVSAALEKVGGTEIAPTAYWSSSQGASNGLIAWNVWFDNGYLDNYGIIKTRTRLVCAVRAF